MWKFLDGFWRKLEFDYSFIMCLIQEFYGWVWVLKLQK